jgi:hypothetical protein
VKAHILLVQDQNNHIIQGLSLRVLVIYGLMEIGAILAEDTDGMKDIGASREEIEFGMPAVGSQEIMDGIGGVDVGSRDKCDNVQMYKFAGL